jgi:hypothetical protein
MVVTAYFEAGAPLSRVRIFAAEEADEKFRYWDEAKKGRGYSVVVQRMGPEGDVVETIPYKERFDGNYFPVDSTTAHPGARYRLKASKPGRPPMTAETTVPHRLRLRTVQPKRTAYQNGENPAFTLAADSQATEQRHFLLTTTSHLDFERRPVDELIAELTPFYRDGFTNSSSTRKEVEKLRVTSSPLSNEASHRLRDGTVTIELPWREVAFYGLNTVAITSVDDNLFDFLRTQKTQQMSLAPGEVPNVLEDVEGGTGIVGSFARVTAEVQIERAETPDS